MTYRLTTILLIGSLWAAGTGAQDKPDAATPTTQERRVLHVGAITCQGDTNPLLSNVVYHSGQRSSFYNNTFTFFVPDTASCINKIIVTKSYTPRLSSTSIIRSMRVATPYLEIQLERTIDTQAGTTSWQITPTMHTTPYTIRENDPALVILADPLLVDTDALSAPVWELEHAAIKLPTIPFKDDSSQNDKHELDAALATMEAINTRTFHALQANDTALESL
ncbi:hypothetical protein HOL34_03535 [bacterium]|jgi:hypothetical protein|nr:hypothetical protein [bacterium]MBT3903864.1 hypothetical protein [bacterium]MBT4578008.1 hypothetical protein [bacterium]MBT5346207.1 hypothetical protein [bacterium]MBT6131003.1 hypothetical protein [bacterium]